MKPKRFCIGDIHGKFDALKEVLTQADFDYKKDKLIILGDVVDGGFQSYEVVEELLKIKNKIFILGNHDDYFIQNIKSGWRDEIWLQQGGCATLQSYGAKCKEGINVSEESEIDSSKLNIPITHQKFFNSAVLYYIEDNMLFVHGGFNPAKRMEYQDRDVLLWDRELIELAKKGKKKIGKWDKIFVGHTSTQQYGFTKPLKFNNLWMLDCGCGWDGRLCLQNIDTDEYFSSSIQLRPE